MAARPRDIHDRAFAFACEVVRFCDRGDGRHTTRRLLLQLLAAGTSVGANLEEASAGQTKRDFIAKIGISRKEAREALYWLRVISATRTALTASAHPLIEEAASLIEILTAIQRKPRPARTAEHRHTMLDAECSMLNAEWLNVDLNV